jgi:hypothetical protein
MVHVLSALGVMFTADHERAAQELARVCRPGGTIGLVSWTPSGFVGQMLKEVASHVPPPPGVQPPPRWGTEEYVRELLGDHAGQISFSIASVTMRFPSPEFYADFFIEHYGPTRKASEGLDEEGRAAFRADLGELARRTTGAPRRRRSSTGSTWRRSPSAPRGPSPGSPPRSPSPRSSRSRSR